VREQVGVKPLPVVPLDAASGNRHALKGYYRFLNNAREDLNLESLLPTHRRQTIRRMKRESTALIVQDTTELNFSTRSACEGLGQLGTNQTGAQSRGLDLHSCLAVGESGLPLGVLRLHGYAPEPAQGKDPRRPIQEKESYRWLEAYQDASLIAAMIPETRVINVTDREGDMFELFDLRRCQRGRKAELLVRANDDRCLEGSDRKLFEELAAAPLAKTVSIPFTSVKQALKCLRWYCRRWRIEEWHRVMKSGCQILGHQNHRAHVLLRAIALDAVIAWRIMLLALLAREVPELPAGTLFDPSECEALGLLTQKQKTLAW